MKLVIWVVCGDLLDKTGLWLCLYVARLSHVPSFYPHYV